MNLIYFVLASFFSKKAMIQPPTFDIEYWRNYSRPFLFRKLQWSKIQNIYCNFFNFQYIIIFLLDGLQPHHPPFILSIDIPVSINWTLRTLLMLISTMVIFTSSLNNIDSQQKIPGSVKKWKVPGTKCITTVKHPIKKKNALSKDHGELQRKVLND